MSNTIQRLASRSFTPESINANQVLNVPTGLIFKDGTPAIPWFVQIDGPCPFLQILQKNADGSFDIWNPTENVVLFDWIAHHVHSIEQEPIYPVATVATPSTVPAPAQLCALPGYENLPTYLLGSYWLTVLETNQSARNATPSNILTDTEPDALNNAVAAASAGDVIEVRTNATYNPVTIPAATELIIRAGEGYTPSISGQEALKLSNGASKVILSGFTFSGCSTPATNYSGAAVTFAALNSIVDNIIFDRCTFAEVQNGSAVMLSYHWSQGGDNYQNPPQPGEESENISFIECTFDQACKEATEGAALSLRPVRRPFVYKCSIDGKNYAVGNGCRGIQLQNCPEAMIHSNEIYNMIGNGEGIKFDTIGAPVALYPTGQVIKNQAHNCIEGIDIDDNSFVTAIDNQCYDNTDEGISVDDSAVATLTNNLCWNNNDGILLENGAVTELQNNHCYANPNNNYNILNGYTLPTTNIDGLTTPADTDPADKRQGMIPADMVSTDQTEERANARWNGSQPASVQDALSKIVNNQYAPFEPAIGSANQGDILYRDATQWNRLVPGNAGEFLQTQGAGANPLWAAAAAGGKNLAPFIVVGSQDEVTPDVAGDCDYLHQNGVTDAITPAINAAKAENRGRIYIRRGLYQIPASQGYYQINDPITIEGEGIDETIIEFQNTQTGTNISWLYLGFNSDKSVIKNLTIRIPDFAMTIDGAITLGGNNCILENVKIQYGGTTTRLGRGAINFGAGKLNNVCRNVIVNEEKHAVPVTAFYLSGNNSEFGNKIIDCYGYAQSVAPSPVPDSVVYCFQFSKTTIRNSHFETDGSQSGPVMFFYASNDQVVGMIVKDNKVEKGYIEFYSSGTAAFKRLDCVNNEINAARYGIKHSPQASQCYINYSNIDRNKIFCDDQACDALSIPQLRYTSTEENQIELTYSDEVTLSRGIYTENSAYASLSRNNIFVASESALNHTGIESVDSGRMRINGNEIRMGDPSTGNPLQGYGIIVRRLGSLIYFNICEGNSIYVKGAICSGIYYDNNGTAFLIHGSIVGNIIEVFGNAPVVQGDASGIRIRNNCLKISVGDNAIGINNQNTVGLFLDGGGALCTGVADGNSISNPGGTSLPISPAGAPGTFVYGNNHIA